MAYPSDNLADVLTSLGTDAGTASTALGTISAGSDVLVSNFAGLKLLVDDLSALATVLKAQAFYVPVGGIIPFGGLSGNMPAGWLVCDGSAVSQTTYADLYAVLGASAYGTDSGGNFFLPDLRGRVPFGYVASSAQFGARTSTEGTTTATARSTAHAHTTPDHTHSNGTLFSAEVRGGGISYYLTGGSAGWTDNTRLATGSPVGDTNNFTGGVKVLGDTSGSGVLTGSTAANPVPYAVANYIIKV